MERDVRMTTIEQFVLDELGKEPATYAHLWTRWGNHPDCVGDAYRKMDGALQKLRKRGQITFVRIGKEAYWGIAA
jgi:hypothetical protein